MSIESAELGFARGSSDRFEFTRMSFSRSSLGDEIGIIRSLFKFKSLVSSLLLRVKELIFEIRFVQQLEFSKFVGLLPLADGLFSKLVGQVFKFVGQDSKSVGQASKGAGRLSIAVDEQYR